MRSLIYRRTILLLESRLLAAACLLSHITAKLPALFKWTFVMRAEPGQLVPDEAKY